MTTYRSKDIDYMKKLKKAVLKGMRGRLPDEKTYTWEYVRKQVTLDDLHKFTISQLGKLVQFPTENFNAPLMLVFLTPPDEIEMNLVNKMIKGLGLKEEDVYITYYKKTEAKESREQATLMEALNGEISIVNPKLVLSFGPIFTHEPHEVIDFKDAKLMVTYDLKFVLRETDETEQQARKEALWNDVKSLMQYYKM